MQFLAARLMAILAISVFCLDQITKALVVRSIRYGEEVVLLDGFFKLVHWGNTGAAWSLMHKFHASNQLLTIVSLVAFLILFINRHHFDSHTKIGQLSLGLIFGGIMGNLVDRMLRDHVVDFIYFYLYQRGGGEVGFPAFNVADSAICTGVSLLFIHSWRKEMPQMQSTPQQIAQPSVEKDLP